MQKHEIKVSPEMSGEEYAKLLADFAANNFGGRQPFYVLDFAAVIPELSAGERQRIADNRMALQGYREADGKTLQLLPHCQKGYWFAVLTNAATGVQDYMEKAVPALFAVSTLKSWGADFGFRFLAVPCEPIARTYFVELAWLKNAKGGAK